MIEEPTYSGNINSIEQVDRIMNHVDNKILDLLGHIANSLDSVTVGINLTLGTILKNVSTKVKQKLANNSRIIAKITKKIQESLPYPEDNHTPIQSSVSYLTDNAPVDINDVNQESFIPTPIPEGTPFECTVDKANCTVTCNDEFGNPVVTPIPNCTPSPSKPPVEPPVEPPTNPPLPPQPPIYICGGSLGEPQLGFGLLPTCGTATPENTRIICGTIQTYSNNTISGDFAAWLKWAFKSKDCFTYNANNSTFYNRSALTGHGNISDSEVSYSINVPYQRNTVDRISPYTEEGENLLWERFSQLNIHNNALSTGNYGEFIDKYTSYIDNEPFVLQYSSLASNPPTYV